VSSLAASLVARYLPESPLRHAAFRRFYAGSIGTALGWTMQTTVAAWLMATLTPSALMVASVQTASTAPALLLGLAAGALADIVDRRRIIVWTHVALVAVTAALGLGELADIVGPWALLLGTFAVGTAFAIYLPAQQANINDIVSRTDIPRAVSLGGVAFNVARAIGPAVAGAIAASLSSGGALLFAATCFSAMVVAMWSAKSPARLFSGLPETLWSGIQAGVRYARHSAPMRALILRNLSFSVCASALWALMPLVARDRLALGAGAYGTLMASFGVGAIAGALALPHAIGRKPLNAVVTRGTVLWALSAALVAVTTLLPLAALGAAGAGASWVTVMSCLSTATQSTAPAWVRARAVATNLVTNQASLALGSIFWGIVAERAGVAIALGVSAAALAVVLVLHRRVRVAMGEEADVTPGAKLPDLQIAFEPGPEDGPVLIQIEYRIAPEHGAEFLEAIHAVEATRRRNGASSWRVFRDLGEEGKYVERFIIESWAEYTRLRTRMTQAERRVQDRAERLQRADQPLRVSRFIGVGRDEAESAG
jgi:MFS family permease/quinol monooxygenase YgiN